MMPPGMGAAAHVIARWSDAIRTEVGTPGECLASIRAVDPSEPAFRPGHLSLQGGLLEVTIKLPVKSAKRGDGYVELGFYATNGPPVRGDGQEGGGIYGLLRLGPGVWTMAPMFIHPGLIAGYLTIHGAPEPADWAKPKSLLVG